MIVFTSQMFYDQHTLCWRTRQISLIEDSRECFYTLPRSGHMNVNGFVSPRPTLAVKYKERGSSLSLPAPIKSDGTDYYTDIKKLKIYFQRRHQQKLSHLCLLAGLNRLATMVVANSLMGFREYPKGFDLSPSQINKEIAAIGDAITLPQASFVLSLIKNHRW